MRCPRLAAADAELGRFVLIIFYYRIKSMELLRLSFSDIFEMIGELPLSNHSP